MIQVVKPFRSQGDKLQETRGKKHLNTDWSDIDRFPRLFALGCVDPVPFIEDDPDCPGGRLYSIRCKETGLVFSAAEAIGRDWIPTPDELIERRNAVRDSWTEEETEYHEAACRLCSVADLREERRVSAPIIQSSYAIRAWLPASI